MAAASELSRRLFMAFDLYAAGEEIMRQNLRRRFPDATAGELEAKLVEWLGDRPGAKHGDAVGRPRAIDL